MSPSIIYYSRPDVLRRYYWYYAYDWALHFKRKVLVFRRHVYLEQEFEHSFYMKFKNNFCCCEEEKQTIDWHVFLNDKSYYYFLELNYSESEIINKFMSSDFVFISVFLLLDEKRNAMHLCWVLRIIHYLFIYYY